MLGSNSSKDIVNKKLHKKYYKCSRCGYISIIQSNECPVCLKDGVKIKMK